MNRSDTIDGLLSAARRRLVVARAIHWALLLTVALGLALGPLVGLDWLAILALVAIFVWVFLVFRSARLVREVRRAWPAANLGRLDEARTRAREALEGWPLLRSITVSAANVLAVVLHREGSFAEAARCCRFVLSRSERLLVGDRTTTQLLLVESLLALEEVPAARAAALPLYGMKLSLAEALKLLSLQLRLEARMGAFASMVDRLPAKVEMAELMPTEESARAQALLMLAADRTGQTAWASFLHRRVELLGDWPALQAAEPPLRAMAAPAA